MLNNHKLWDGNEQLQLCIANIGVATCIKLKKELLADWRNQRLLLCMANAQKYI